MKPIISYSSQGHKTFDLDLLAEALETDVKELKIRAMSVALSAVFNEAEHLLAIDNWDAKVLNLGGKPPTEKQIIAAARSVFGFEQTCD
jgi:hypothetical protein